MKTPVSERLFKIKVQMSPANLVKKAQVFSCEFCEVFKKTWATASELTTPEVT